MQENVEGKEPMEKRGYLDTVKKGKVIKYLQCVFVWIEEMVYEEREW